MYISSRRLREGENMKNRFLVYAGLLAVIAFSGCTGPYTPAPQILPQHVRKIFIKPFVNSTSQYGLEDKLTLAVTNSLINDGRFAVVNNEGDADGVLVGEISKYMLQPLTYDVNMVTQQYKLWILVNIYFVDRVKNVTLWSEPNLEGIQIYYDATQPGGMTEEEARQVIWNNMSQDIVRRIVDGFGAVTGISDKKVPNSN